ncbi:hypothetical protein OH687_13190 [Burkholderia anthina]|nr:hypothetical protein OH687_13190 [Burkholderia anthina]
MGRVMQAADAGADEESGFRQRPGGAAKREKRACRAGFPVDAISIEAPARVVRTDFSQNRKDRD